MERKVEGWIENNKPLKKIDEGVKQQGWRMLMITRLVPLFPFNVQNYVYGLTDIPFRTYVLVTLPTMIPATIAYNFASGSAREVILSGGPPRKEITMVGIRFGRCLLGVLRRRGFSVSLRRL